MEMLLAERAVPDAGEEMMPQAENPPTIVSSPGMLVSSDLR